jgi:hypothetical protein
MWQSPEGGDNDDARFWEEDLYVQGFGNPPSVHSVDEAQALADLGYAGLLPSTIYTLRGEESLPAVPSPSLPEFGEDTLGAELGLGAEAANFRPAGTEPFAPPVDWGLPLSLLSSLGLRLQGMRPTL